MEEKTQQKQNAKLVLSSKTLSHAQGKGCLAKLKDAKKQSEARKFERLRQKFEECKDSSPRHETKENTQEKTG